jgi:lysophospholipase L1-like esterase
MAAGKFFLGYVCPGLAMLVLLACGDSARLSPLPEDATILAFGDSLTVGVGVTPKHSYPGVLAKVLDLNVINGGVSGEVTVDGKDRLVALLAQSKADLLIICHGGNDFLHRFALAETEKNLRAMVSHAQSLGVETVLIGVPKPGVWGRAPDLYKRVADDFNIPLDDEILGQLETDPAMKSDPVHLNQAGYQKLAEAVVALLVEAGAVSAPQADL